MNILVHIPARGGSKGIPRKNLRTMLGVSLVGWAVLAARRLRAVLGGDAALRILVDTDDDDIAGEGLAWGAEVPYRRPPEFARDEAPTAGAVQYAIRQYRDMGWPPEAVILLQPTSPLRRTEDVVACLSPFLAGASPSVVSVAPLEHPLELAQAADATGVLTARTPLPGGAIRRQDGTGAVFPSGAVYVIGSELLVASSRFLHDGITIGVELPRSRSLDIDLESDLELADSVARGEALSSPPTGQDLAAARSVTRWREVELAQLPGGLTDLEASWRAGGEGIALTAPPTPTAQGVFDGVAACRRATGLPIAWTFDRDRPELATTALSAGAAALLALDAAASDIENAERISRPWPGRSIITS